MRLYKQIAPWVTGAEFVESYYYQDSNFSAATSVDRKTIQSPDFLALDIGGSAYQKISPQQFSLDADASWDFGQSIGTWQANHAYSAGDFIRPTSIADGALNTSTAYATPAYIEREGYLPVYDSYVGERYPRQAFDRSTSDSLYWFSNSTAYPHWIGVRLTSPQRVNKFRYYGYGGLSPKSWKFQGSQDNSTWVDLLDNSSSTISDPGGNWSPYFTFSNSTAYLYYRLYITNGYGFPARNDVIVYELHLVAQPQLVYKCISAGTSGSSEPTWGTTVAGTTSDSGATWTAYYDDTVALNRAGTDYYIYACQTATTAPKVVLSRNSTYPHGYTANNSRKIGGFHCLCNSVRTIANHDLTGYLTGDVLPASVWDYNWRSASGSNVGLTYSSKLQKWVGIYLMSGTVSAPTILNGGTILDTITWFQACDAAKALKMKLPKDYEFQVFAAGTPEGVNIYGSADPVTTGGYISTGSVRMISNIGCEDCSGSTYQWLDETCYRFDAAATHTHSVTLDGNAQASVTSGNASGDVAPAWSWKAQTGGKGSLYTQGTYGIVKVLAGGARNESVNCGSRGRNYSIWSWSTGSAIGIRFIAEHIDRRI